MKQYAIWGLLCMLHMPLLAQEWSVPDDKKSRLSTFPFNDQTRTQGTKIFNDNCKSCHGDPAKANFQKLSPEPGDVAGTKFVKDTDGELFFKISEGRGAMPSFKNTLKTDEIWQVISYIRNFHSGYAQSVAKKIELSGFEGLQLMIALQGTQNGEIEATVVGKNDETTKPLQGAGVSLFTLRTFGMVPADEEKLTDANGKVRFKPTAIPGDSIGQLHLVAKLTNAEQFGDIQAQITLPLGKPTQTESLRAHRAMWNTMKMAPIWLLATYFLVVIGVWGTIFYLLFQLRDIYFIGKFEKEDTNADTQPSSH